MTLQQETQPWNVRDLMKISIEYLQRHGFEEARLTVELLLSHALQCQRIELYTRFDQPLRREEINLFRTLFERRLKHEPTQYIVGSAGFMGMQFKVDRRVLIPRPETETLVEQVMLACGRHKEGEAPSVLEIGTGSGNIAVSIAKLVRGIRVTSIDVNREALDVGRENAAIHHVAERVTFREMSLFDPLPELLKDKFDVIVSNPPYVSAEDWEHLAPEIKMYEPQGAVCDLKDGYEFYRRIAQIGPSLLLTNGCILVEVGHGQSETVQKIFGEVGLVDLSVANDLQGVPRVVMGVNS